MAQLRLDAQAKGAGGRVVEIVTRLRVEDVANQMAHVGGREELAGAAAPLGKLADEVLVGAAQEVGLHVVEAQALFAEDVDQARQGVVVEQALVALGGVEVAAVDDADQVLVLAGDGAQVIGQQRAQAGGLVAHRAPTGLGRQIEADE